jgi:hypothetical protein
MCVCVYVCVLLYFFYILIYMLVYTYILLHILYIYMLLYIFALSLLPLYICCFTGRWKKEGAAGGMDEVGWRLEGPAKVPPSDVCGV